MKRILHLLAAAAALLAAQPSQKGRAPESLDAWQYYKVLNGGATPGALLSVTLDRDVLDRARPDLADLRIYNAAGVELPYALRIRREVNVHDVREGREFNRAVEGDAAVVSIDLAESPTEHNQVDVDTAGANFRRFADIQGSSDGAGWSTLAVRAVVFRFAADGRSVEQAAITYPASRHRYLRVRVYRDPQTDHSAPEIQGVRVRRSVHVAGEMTSFAAVLGIREADRAHGRAASVWSIDLGGSIPVERLQIALSGGPFARPYELMDVDDPANPQFLASGELRQTESASQPVIDFSEHAARHLKLVITDDRNEPLMLNGVTAMAPARQLVVETASAGAGPLRLYYGSSKAAAPHYDIEARIPANSVARLVQMPLGPQQENPTYHPEEKPFTERYPWMVYVVLGLACLVLAWILLGVLRAAEAAAAPPGGQAASDGGVTA